MRNNILTLGVCLLLASCSKLSESGPNEAETKTLTQKGVESYMGPNFARNVSVENILSLGSSKQAGGDDWRVDVKYDTVLLKPTDPVLDLSAVGCNTQGCRHDHRDSLTVRKSSEGWYLVKRTQMP